MHRRIAHTPLNAGRKPSVLLVDDHRQILDTVSVILSKDFDVVGTAGDGTQALDKARQLQPDVIVMDVEMPGMDGFQTVRTLNRSGIPATPVVFLSMHDADDIVGEAFRCGGKGYVLKQRVGRDLGARSTRRSSVVRSCRRWVRYCRWTGMHAMLLYNSPESFADGLADLFDVALRRGDATCVIATRPVRQGLGDRLQARGRDVNGSSGHKRYLAVDSTDALSGFMRNGLPVPTGSRKWSKSSNQYRRVEGQGAAPRLTLAGRMAGLLAEEGNAQAAIEVESLWNRLTHHLPFFTICGYGSGCFHDGVPDLWSSTCS